MRRAALLLFPLLPLLPSLARAAPAQPISTAGLLCRQAIEAASRMEAIPPGLLGAIGRVESGRRDPLTGMVNPWPWTINVEGTGYTYGTKAEAVAAVGAFRARGARSIDVGCMQVNLMHHPNAFASLDQALDPGANAAYAARFLRQLMDQTHDWGRAAALYHSATPELAAEYGAKVRAAWPQETALAGAFGATPLSRAWPAYGQAVASGWSRPVMGGFLSRHTPPARVVAASFSGGAQAPGRTLAIERPRLP